MRMPDTARWRREQPEARRRPQPEDRSSRGRGRGLDPALGTQSNHRRAHRTTLIATMPLARQGARHFRSIFTRNPVAAFPLDPLQVCSHGLLAFSPPPRP
jgi:hypothetical protein